MSRAGLSVVVFALLILILALNLGLSDSPSIPTDIQEASNSEVEIEWDQIYGGIASEFAYSVLQTADGGFVLAGITVSYGVSGWYAWLLKIRSSGASESTTTNGLPALSGFLLLAAVLVLIIRRK